MKISKDQENIQRIYEGFNMNTQQPSDNLANSQHPNSDTANSTGAWRGITTAEKPDRLTPHENEEGDILSKESDVQIGDILLPSKTTAAYKVVSINNTHYICQKYMGTGLTTVRVARDSANFEIYRKV